MLKLRQYNKYNSLQTTSIIMQNNMYKFLPQFISEKESK